MHSVPKDVPGEPAAFWLFALVAPPLEQMVSLDGFALPDPEPIMLGAAYPWDATAADIRGLTRACKKHGLGPPLSQKEFVGLLMRVCWINRGALVAFQLPSEIGRLQVRFTRAARKPGRGGIVMTLATVPGEPSRRQPLCDNGEIEDPDLPRIVILPIDAKRARVWFKPVPGARRDGAFASLQPLAETLSGARLETVRDGCEAFEIDCEPTPSTSAFATAMTEIREECRLYRVLLEQHVSLCPDEPPTPYVSPGTYAKAMLRQAGLRPPLQRWTDFPDYVLAATMAAYHSGEVDVHLRGAKLPARLFDFDGAFGIAGSLIGAWGMLAPEEVAVQEIPPAEAVELLERFATEFRQFVHGGPPPSPEAWRAAWITLFLAPNADVLPHRPRQGEGWTSTRAPLTYRKGDIPWQAPDVIVHLLEGGEMPRIGRAFRLVPSGRAPLRQLTLPGGRIVDPSKDDLVALLRAERTWAKLDPTLNRYQRRRLSGLLKGVVVSLLAGLTIQVNDDEPTKTPRKQRVFHPRTGEATTRGVNVLETPGDWYWPPVAAATTATAHLLLHLVIEMVHAAGGMVAYWDTDSVLIVTLPDGGLVPCPGGSERMPDGREAVRALSFQEVEKIRRRVDRLLPSENLRAHVQIATPPGEQVGTPQPSLLELEPKNFGGPSGFARTLYAATRASKKYHLYEVEDVGPHVEVENGTGVVIEPTAEEASRPQAIRVSWASEHGLPFEAPADDPSWVASGFEHILGLEWEAQSAMPDSWTTPAITHVPAARPDILKRHPDARPFCTLAVANIPLAGQVVAPMHRSFDPGRTDWRDAEGLSVRTILQGVSLLQTLGDAQLRAWNASDTRTVAADGKSVGPRTEGVTLATPSVAGRLRLTGKESRHLGIGRGVLHKPEFIDYGGDDDWPDVLLAARRLSLDGFTRKTLREAAGVADREFSYWLSRTRTPGARTHSRLLAAVANAARERLRQTDAFASLPVSDLDVIAAFLDLPEPQFRCVNCGKSLTGRGRKWCHGDRCRKQFERSEQLMLTPPNQNPSGNGGD